MKRNAAALLVCLALLAVGCEYAVPLVADSEMPVDRSIVGLWQRVAREGESPRQHPEHLLVLPWSQTRYVVGYPAKSPHAMIANAALVDVADIRMAQLEWIGTIEGRLPENDNTFQYATYTLDADDENRLTVRLLNSDVVTRDATSAADLNDAIRRNSDNPDLFRAPMVFTRVTPE